MIISCWPPWYTLLLLFKLLFEFLMLKFWTLRAAFSRRSGHSCRKASQRWTWTTRQYFDWFSNRTIPKGQSILLVRNFISLTFDPRLDTPQNYFISSRFAFPNSPSCISSTRLPLERSVEEHKWPLWLWISFGPLYPWLPLPRSAPRLGLSYPINASIRSVFTFLMIKLERMGRKRAGWKPSKSRRSGTLSEP